MTEPTTCTHGCACTADAEPGKAGRCLECFTRGSRCRPVGERDGVLLPEALIDRVGQVANDILRNGPGLFPTRAGIRLQMPDVPEALFVAAVAEHQSRALAGRPIRVDMGQEAAAAGFRQAIARSLDEVRRVARRAV